MHRLVLWLKRLHPSWGAGRIRIGLLSRYDDKRIPSERTMQRWFKEKNLTKPPQQRAQPPIGSSKAVHNIWQVDAKENITSLDGKAACYLTLTDEKSGSWLSSMAFAYGRISQVPVEEVREKLIESFCRWGKPGAMRVDNGEPLGHSTMMMTSPLALWLIGMDIDMIFNTPIADVQLGCRHDNVHSKMLSLSACNLLPAGGWK